MTIRGESTNSEANYTAQADMQGLGIAITTFNRARLVCEQVDVLRRLTSCSFELVVCDDGSTDDTVPTLREKGINVVTGHNRGVAWNKNRGLFYLLSRTASRILLLLDDDILPTEFGWERNWIEAILRVGHINYILPDMVAESVLEGGMTGSSPGLATQHLGPVIGCSRESCAYVGYFDPRFIRWGFEHVDFTDRFLRAGYGGLLPHQNSHKKKLYYVLNSGVALLPGVSTVTSDERKPLISRNGEILIQSREEPIYRCPWREDNELYLLQRELEEARTKRPERPEHSLYQPAFANETENKLDVARPSREGAPDHLFLVHIPKTGGTLVNHLLSCAYGTGAVLLHVESKPEIWSDFNAISKTKFLSGHLRLPAALGAVDRKQSFIFALLRNPVDRLISHLKWVKALGALALPWHFKLECTLPSFKHAIGNCTFPTARHRR